MVIVSEDDHGEKEKKSEDIGCLYLWGRIGEYTLKTAGNVILIFYGNSLSAKILTASGSLSGDLGNALQTYQGYQDRQLALRYPGRYSKTDKLLFARVAMIRGNMNLLSDSISIIRVFLPDGFFAKTLTVISLGSTLSTDTLGLIKNIRDVRKSVKQRKPGLIPAFGFCATARPLFMISSLAMILYQLEITQEQRWILGSTIIGMLLFNFGGVIRQGNYYKGRCSDCFNRFFVKKILSKEPVVIQLSNLELGGESSEKTSAEECFEDFREMVPGF